MSRTVRIALGYGAAMILATFLMIVLVAPRLDGRPGAGAIPLERLPEALLSGILVSAMAALVPAVLLALPVLGLVAWAERRRARGAPLHAAVGLLGGAAMAVVLGAGRGAGMAPALAEIGGFALAGLAGAMAYWAISGRHAGRA